VGRARPVTAERLNNWWDEAAQELDIAVPSSRESPLPQHLTPRPGEHPAEFLRRTLPASSLIPTAPRHNAVWDWVASLEPGQAARPRVEIWGRGGAKSTIAEMACAYLACTLSRRFALYVCGTQDQADLHVQAIAALLEQMGIPRAVNAYSASVNWTAQRLQTVNGFGVVGVGLNSRVRGARLGEFRPDLIILDDIDETHDSPQAVTKKLKTVTSAVFAAGSADATVLFIQNKIHKDSAIAQVADGRAEILLGASVVEEPAVVGLEYERTTKDGKPYYKVTAGEPTWPEGQGLAVAEKQINEWGLPTFLQESQHEDAPDGGLWNRANDIDPYRASSPPAQFQRIVIGVDPPGGATEAGIVAVGKTYDGHYYVMHDDSGRGTPNEWMRRAVDRYWALKADTLAVETNFGGDMVQSGIRNVDARVGVKEVRASRGKAVRAEPVHQLYQSGLVHHVGVFLDLETELCTWQVGDKSPNRLDALVWAITELMSPPGSISDGGAAIW
jgi:hypothetical protein